jgi:VanZ family protein
VSHRSGWGAAALRWVPAIVWMAVIFGLSSVSGLRVSEDAAIDRPIRASAHLFAFGLLAALLLLALAGRQRPQARHVVVAYVLTLIYAMTDELHQAFVPDRNGRPQDVAIDAIGAAGGVLLGYVALRAWVHLERRRTDTGTVPEDGS